MKLAMISVSGFFLPLFLSQHSLSTVFNSFYLFLFFPFFSHYFRVYLNAVFLHIGLPRLLFPFLSVCSLCQFTIFHSFYMTDPFNSSLTNVFIKLSFTPTSTLSSSTFLSSALLTNDFSYSVVFANLYILLLVPSFLGHTCMPDNTQGEHLSY